MNCTFIKGWRYYNANLDFSCELAVNLVRTLYWVKNNIWSLKRKGWGIVRKYDVSYKHYIFIILYIMPFILWYCVTQTYLSKKNQLIIVQLPSFLNHIILRSKEVDSFNPHLPKSILTDFSVCQLEKINSMGGPK